MKTILLSLCLILTKSSWALQERHLVVIHPGESERVINYYQTTLEYSRQLAPLTSKGKEQAQQIAETLLTYGFDSRNITALYVAPLVSAQETVDILVNIGILSADKVHIEPRLIENDQADQTGNLTNKERENQRVETEQKEMSKELRQKLVILYDEIERSYMNGHVILVTDTLPAKELIEELTHNDVKLQSAQLYLIPLAKRDEPLKG